MELKDALPHVDIETLRNRLEQGEVYFVKPNAGKYAVLNRDESLAILNRLSPPEPEQPDEAREVALAFLQVWYGNHPSPNRAGSATFPAARQVLSELIASKDAEIAKLTGERDRQYDDNVNRIAAEGAAIVRAEKAESELAALRAENERLKADAACQSTALNAYLCHTAQHFRESQDEIASLKAEIQRPIDMLLFCPCCHSQHVDEAKGEWDGKTWDNPPHKSHLCGKCGCIWRPCDRPTNGASTILTSGKADTYKAAERNTAEPAKVTIDHPMYQDGVSYKLKQAADAATDTTPEVVVTQGDREAAADLIEAYWQGAGEEHDRMRELAAIYRAGHTQGVWAYAFARHRTEAEARGRRAALEGARKRVWERLYPENPKSDWTKYARDRADAAEAADDELKRMMAGEK